ncbi:hypothetical protein MUK42_12113 [Musa troglodytarum]|uniref:protein-serine/threonine phosphatase n=1 Tax=Musa troglodytarum TaxID=320322 RepID=A0A9E7GNV3_9LILI|nr:hypothetical protein MUK42_12113 [Musa troglodytarum]
MLLPRVCHLRLSNLRRWPWKMEGMGMIWTSAERWVVSMRIWSPWSANYWEESLVQPLLVSAAAAGVSTAQPTSCWIWICHPRHAHQLPLRWRRVEDQQSQASSSKRSVFLVDYIPFWGQVSICGRRPEMEDAVVAVPYFYEIPLWLLIGNQDIDGLDSSLIRLPAHFFGVYDGHGGSQVADYCRERIHHVLIEQLRNCARDLRSNTCDDWKKQWERAFISCFQQVDDEVGGKVTEGNLGSSDDKSKDENFSDAPLMPIAPETVGSTAVVAVICSSHIIIANCGDSRAVLCRGKQPVPLSVDHKPNREDEYARIEAQGGKVIHWNGYRVFGVLAMSRSIGDHYLKPWIIPVPEVTIVPRCREDECLILASDGLWDVMSNEEVCDIARRRILLWHKKNGIVASPVNHRGEEADPAAQAAADCLSKLAIQKGSKDNITVIVVDLKAQRKFKTKS